MKLFKQLCSIAVVFMFLCGIAMATEIVDPDTNSPPGSVEESPAEPNTDPDPEDSPGTPEEPKSPTGPNEADDSDEPDDPDEEDEEDEEDIEDDLGIYKVTLPTSGTFDFVLDPLGLAGLAEGESATLEELDSGRIYPKSEIPAIVLNESSMPLKLTVEFIAENHIETDEEDEEDIDVDDLDDREDDEDQINFIKPGINLARTKDAVFEGDDLNVLLYAVPSKSGISSLNEEFQPSNLGFVITEDGVELTFLLPAAEYITSGTDGVSTLVRGTGTGTQIRVGGYANDTADWKIYTDDYNGITTASIGLTAIYTLTKLNDDTFEESSQPVGGVMYLRTTNRTALQRSIIVLDEESIDALIPHDQVSETADIPPKSSQRRKQSNFN